MTVSPLSAATLLTASHRSSGMRTVLCGVAGWFGTAHTLSSGVHTPDDECAPLEAAREGRGLRLAFSCWRERTPSFAVAGARTPEQLLKQGVNLRAPLLAHLYLTPVHGLAPRPRVLPCPPSNQAWVTDTR